MRPGCSQWSVACTVQSHRVTHAAAPHKDEDKSGCSFPTVLVDYKKMRVSFFASNSRFKSK